MTSSVETSIRSEVSNRASLSKGTRAYFRARTRNRLYNLVMQKYREHRAGEKLTQVEIARRMGRRPEVVNRLLMGPRNWTVDTISDLLLAIAGEELDATSTAPTVKPDRNHCAVDFVIQSGRSQSSGTAQPLPLRIEMFETMSDA
jgi:hypothetical protein